MMRLITTVVIMLALAISVAFFILSPKTADQTQLTTANRTSEQQAGTRYQPVELHFKPVLTEISVPGFKGANGIWGASGRDDESHIWLGVSGSGKAPAHLMEFDPELDRFVDHGAPCLPFAPQEFTAKVKNRKKFTRRSFRWMMAGCILPDQNRVDWTLTDTTAGSDDSSAYFRVRIRKPVKNEADLMADTNAIRVVTH